MEESVVKANSKFKNRVSEGNEGEKENEILFACQNDNLKC